MKTIDSKIIIIAPFIGDIFSPNNRFGSLIKFLNNWHIEIITTDFNHREKVKKQSTPSQIGNIQFKYIEVPEYPNNLSFRRLYSHIIFGKRAVEYLKTVQDKPDLIYCTMPTCYAAWKVSIYSKKQDIPFIVDVIDVWPDSLLPLTKYKKLTNMIIWPWYFISRQAYSNADYISAESKAYMDIAKKYNPDCPCSYTYLGIDSKICKEMIKSAHQTPKLKNNSEIWLCYGGSLGNSYDFDGILEILCEIKKKAIKYRMFFFGDGEKRRYIEAKSADLALNVEVSGRLPYSELLARLSQCDMAFNSFRPGTKVVHSYKFNDYMAAGLYVLNNLPGETEELIDKYHVGVTYDSLTGPEKVIDACENWDTIKVGIKLRIDTLISENLEKDTIYRQLANNIQNLVK